MTTKPTLWRFWLAGFLFWQVGAGSACQAEEVQAKSPQTIQIAELPKPSKEMKRWLDAGELRISFGGRKRPSNGMTAETTYRMVHRYRSSPRWTIRQVGAVRICVIRLRFRSVQLRTTHEIWFLDRPDLESFWANPLVLHEFDHLRLSADPRLARRFEELLLEEAVIERPVASGESVNGRWVQDQVDQYVQDQFARVSDLALIRYRELDRLTRHGRRPIPDNSEIAETLKELEQ